VGMEPSPFVKSPGRPPLGAQRCDRRAAR
jgi:hypothetical protein